MAGLWHIVANWFMVSKYIDCADNKPYNSIMIKNT